jgi:hypothetical protein
MYDRSLVMDELQSVKKLLQTIQEWTLQIRSTNDFLLSPNGVILLVERLSEKVLQPSLRSAENITLLYQL